MNGRIDQSLSRRSLMRWGIVTGGAAAAAMLAACGGAPAPTPTPPAKAPAADAKPAAAATPTQAAAAPAKAAGQVQLRLHVRTGAEQDTLDEMLPQFEQEKGIKVKVESFPGNEYYQKLQTLLAGNQAGDVWWGVAYTGQFSAYYAEKGIVLYIDELVKADKFDLSQYYEPAIKGITLQGKVYALPFKLHPGVVGIYYNVDAFKSRGAPEPAPKNYDELLQVAKSVTKVEGDKTTQWGLLPNAVSTPHFYIQAARAWGGDIISKDGKTATVNSEPFMGAMQWWSDLTFTHKAAPNLSQVVNRDIDQMYVSGVVGMYQSGSWTKSVPTRIKDKFQVKNVLMPKGPSGKLGLWFVTDIMTINAKTDHRAESWELMKLLCGKELGIRLGEGKGGASGTSGGRKDVFESERLMKHPLHPIWVQAVNTVEEGSEMIIPANYRGDEYRTTLSQRMEKVWLGEEKLTKQYLDEINKALQAILDKPKP